MYTSHRHMTCPALFFHKNHQIGKMPSSTSPQPPSPSASSSQTSSHNQSRATPEASDVDDGLSWRERLSFYQSHALDWYNGLNSDVRTLLKLALAVLALYVAFGGRFGFESTTVSQQQQQQSHSSYPYRAEQSKPSTTTTRGNYGAGNAYDEYYKQKQQQEHHYRRPQGVDPSYHHQRKASSSYESSYYDNNSYYDPPPRRRSSGGLFNSGFSVADLFDGSPLSMAILLGIGYLAHRNGINPFQAIMMLNMIGGRRRGGMYFGGGPFGRRRAGRFRF